MIFLDYYQKSINFAVKIKTMHIDRTLRPVLQSCMGKGKAIILIGPRQVGKTTLFDTIAEAMDDIPLMLNCDEPLVREMLTNPTNEQLTTLIGTHKVLIIDEAQRVDSIGITLKRIVENFINVQVMATGSSSFELYNRLNEPLTGRKYEYHLYPISTPELMSLPGGPIAVKSKLTFRLIYGSYPEVLDNPGEARDLLTSLTDSYLYKDLLALDGIRRPELLNKLLTALALQLGSEVSYNELAQLTGSDSKTVEKYIELLEKCFVLRRMPALSRNMRNELKKSRKVYFLDNGVRNAIIQNYAPIEFRTDMGALWENFFVMERIKYNSYRGYKPRYYFWRAQSQQEIDLIEEADGQFTIFEMKWNPKEKARFPQSFLDNYPVADKAIITPDNYQQYLGCNF